MMRIDNEGSRQACFECFPIGSDELIGVLGLEGDLGAACGVVPVVPDTLGVYAFGVGQGIAVGVACLG